MNTHLKPLPAGVDHPQRNAILTVGLCLFLASAGWAQAQKPSDTPTMKRAPVTVGELEYEIRGEGEPVLLIHGSHIAGSFLPLMDQTSLAGYRLIRYHRRGFAGSTKHDGPFSIERQAADAVALLRHLGVKRAHVVGHSYGGVTALQLALDAPDVVHSLVLLEPAITWVPSGAEFGEKTKAPAMERYHTGDRVGAVESFMKVMVVGPEWRRAIARTVPGGPEQAEQDAATFFEFEMPALDQWKFDDAKARTISQPVLYVLGSESQAMFKEGRDLVRSWFPQAESHLVQDVAHSLQMEDPRAVGAAIGDFLSRHSFKTAIQTTEVNGEALHSRAGRFVRVSPDLELYYEEAGTGRPVIFIPGWAGTTEFYAHQMAHFAKRYHVLTYDPRSQGRSSKTLENNHYIQHGKDLNAFMEALNLKDVVLVGLSWGCLDIYAYFRTFGPKNVKASVFIDEMPRAVARQKGEWAEFADLSEAGAFINAAVYDIRGLIKGFIPTMMKRDMKPQELNWALDQLLKTPNYVSALLAVDGSFADYTEEARMIDGKIAVLNVVSEDQAEAAKVWLECNAPHSEVVVLGKHLMLLEFPDRFNSAVETFLEKLR